jgi:hypothetical protein
MEVSVNRQQNLKHKQNYPTARKIRRSCNKELYRTMKKLKLWVPQEQLSQAEELYFNKVVMNLPWIVEHGSNRKMLADWWEANVCPDIAGLWNVDSPTLAKAFRDSFGG